VDPVELAFAGLARQAELVRGGEVSPRELVERSLERIERIDPLLNSFRVVFAERALAEAKQAEGRRGAGEERPLLGVPIAIKDDTDVAGEVTGRGSRAAGGPAAKDAEMVRRLREAGAIVVGKTHVPELEQWPFTETAAHGTTHNPWDTDRVPGGSSGGSGAAVAAALVPAASGSDGAGSIRIPAACCGLFGLKPTRGRVPHPQGWHGLSVVGSLVRRTEDASLWLEVVANGFERPAGPPGKLRIAVSKRFPPTVVSKLDPEMEAAFDATVSLLDELGHEVSEREPDLRLAQLDVTVRYLRGIRDDARSMAHPERLERRTKAMARMGSLIPEALFNKVLENEERMVAQANAVFAWADVLLTPALARPAPRVGSWEGRGALGTVFGPGGVNAFTPYTPPWNAAGNPGASIPAGFSREGLPLAVQVVGRQMEEATLIALAAQIEEARPWADRRPELAG